jgi:APA family basic amino acid/polyamine antiporter
MIIVGDIIGVGIFMTPGLIAASLGHPGWIFGVWVVGGLLTLMGALTYAELGGALPRAGGEYVYLREAYGPLFGFLNGWTLFAVTNPGSIAVMAVTLVAYLQTFLPFVSPERVLWDLSWLPGAWSVSTGNITALVIVFAFSAVNYFGVRAGSVVQNVLAVTKVGAIMVLVILGFAVGTGSFSHFAETLVGSESAGLSSGLTIALMAVFFSFTGWFASAYVAGEIREPQKNVPRSIILGALIVTTVYLLVNAVYFYAMPVSEMAGVLNVGETSARALFGDRASTFISLAIIISIMGTINAVVLTSPRVYYAMARDGLFFGAAGRVHPRFKSPGNSILIQAVFAGVLVFFGSFTQLLTYTTVAMLSFSIMTGISIFVLRLKQPDLERPYRTWGYPWVPLVFVLSYIAILVHVTVSRPQEALLGLSIVALGVPIYFIWTRRERLFGRDAADHG